MSLTNNGSSASGGERAKYSGDAGFTVIELLIAFTILAIISGSLFQMFFVTARYNARAEDLDIANSLAITAAELFKTSSGLDGTAMFRTQPGAISGYTWRNAGGDRFVKYYDGSWNEMEISLPAAGLEADKPKDARYLLEAGLRESRAAGPDLSYVFASFSLDLDHAQDYRLVINENAEEIEVVFNGVPQTVGKSVAGRVISVNIEFSSDGVLPKHIAVVNRTGYMANVNIFGLPGAIIPDPRNAGAGSSVSASVSANADASGYIEVSPVSGSISVMYLDDLARVADNLTRFITVTVRELSPGEILLASAEASRYVPG